MRRRAAVILASFLGAGSCRGSGQSDEIVVASVTRCTDAHGPTPRAYLPLEGRRKEFFPSHPLATVQNQGGRILAAPRATAVFFDDDPLRPATEVQP
jgi:hypothetical protein